MLTSCGDSFNLYSSMFKPDFFLRNKSDPSVGRPLFFCSVDSLGHFALKKLEHTQIMRILVISVG